MPERLRSGFLQAEKKKAQFLPNDPPARVSAQAPRFFVIYDSQFPLASSFGRDSIQYRVGKTHCQGHQDPNKRVPIFSFATQGGKQVSSHFRQRNWVQARDAQIRFSAG